jgi:hypothetical protein
MGAFILLKNQGQLNWVPRPTLQQVHDFANFFLGEGGFVLFAAYTTLFLAALFWPPVWQGRECCGFDQRWRTRLVLWWLAFPIVSTLLVSLVKPIFYDRYMIICAPALVLLAGQGIAKLDQISVRPGGIFSIALTVMIGLSVWGFHRYSSSSASEGDDWRLVTNYISAHQQPGDAAFFYRASGSRPFLYYAHEIEKQSRVYSPEIVFPVDVNDSLDFNVEPNKKQVKRLLEGHQRIWLILQHYQGLQVREVAAVDIQAALHEGFDIFEERVFPGLSGTIRVLLYVRTPILDSNYKP